MVAAMEVEALGLKEIEEENSTEPGDCLAGRGVSG